MIDFLERRRLLAAVVSYAADKQILRVNSDNAPDVVEFGVSARTGVIDVSINAGTKQLFNESDTPVRVISIAMGGGADLVILGRVPIPAIVRGGPGNDSISGGNGNDTLLGEGGFDYLYGRPGNDELFGGAQGDVIFGATGDDVLFAGGNLVTNDDTISGGPGNDRLDYSRFSRPVVIRVGDFIVPDVDISDRVFNDIETVLGSQGDDDIRIINDTPIVIDGKGGNDTVTGGLGNDTLNGGLGSDTINGLDGDDRIISNDGAADIVDAGAGTDTAQSDDGIDTVSNVP